MNWDGGNTATAWNAAGSGNNPLSPEYFFPSFRWGNGPASGTSGNYYFGSGWSVNRYVSMADFSIGGDLASGRYHGAGSGITSDFNYRYVMSGEYGDQYGRDT